MLHLEGLAKDFTLHLFQLLTHGTPVDLGHMAQVTEQLTKWPRHGVFSCPVCVHAQLLSHVQLFATPWTVACQASLSMRFPRHEYWSGLSFPPPGDPPNSGIELASCVFLCIGRRVLFHCGNWQALSCSAAAAAKSRQSCPTLCDPIDGSPPGSPVPGILQARTLEWGAISFSNA